MAAKLRIEYDDLQTEAEGDFDVRGRRGEADVPVHHSAIRLIVRIRTDADDRKLERLKDLVARYCPVDSMVRASVPDYTVTWERL